MKRKLPFIHIEMKKENNVIIKVASYFNHYNSKVNVYTCVEKNVVEWMYLTHSRSYVIVIFYGKYLCLKATLDGNYLCMKATFDGNYLCTYRYMNYLLMKKECSFKLSEFEDRIDEFRSWNGWKKHLWIEYGMDTVADRTYFFLLGTQNPNTFHFLINTLKIAWGF